MPVEGKRCGNPHGLPRGGRKRHPPLQTQQDREGKQAHLAPTAKMFSCTRCPYTSRNRFDALRRHFVGKHKLSRAELEQEVALYKVILED